MYPLDRGKEARRHGGAMGKNRKAFKERGCQRIWRISKEMGKDRGEYWKASVVQRERRQRKASYMWGWTIREENGTCIDRDQAGKDVQQIRMIKDGDGNVLTSRECVLGRWEEHFERLVKDENERTDGGWWVRKCRKLEGGSEKSYIEDLEKKAFGPHNIPVEVWRWILLSVRTFNMLLHLYLCPCRMMLVKL